MNMAAASLKAWRCLQVIFTTLFVCFFIYIIITYVSVQNACHKLENKQETKLPTAALSMGNHFRKFFLHLLNLTESLPQTHDQGRDQEVDDPCNKSVSSVLFLILSSEVPNDASVFISTTHNFVIESFSKIYHLLHYNVATSSLIESTVHFNKKSALCLLTLFSLLIMCCGYAWFGTVFRVYRNGRKPDKDLDNSKKNAESSAGNISNPNMMMRLSNSWEHISPKLFLSEQGLSKQSLCKILYFSMWKWILISVSCAALLSLPWEFVRMYQKAVASRAANVYKGLPQECGPDTASLWSNLKSFLRWQLSWSHDHDPCLDYYYATLVDPLWEVNPLLVITSVLSRGVFLPLEVVSSSLGRSLRLFFAEIPSHWQPVVMFVSVITMVIILLILCRYRLSIPLLMRIEPRTPVHYSPKDVRVKSYRSQTERETEDFSLHTPNRYKSHRFNSEKFSLGDT